MTLSKDLFLSVLSMDAYNRGYGAAISNLGGLGSSIGNATLVNQNVSPEAVSAGFYAVAYDTSGVAGFSAGEKTIAYRGTDVLSPLGEIGSEIWNAYGVGAGSPLGNQAALAYRFYQV